MSSLVAVTFAVAAVVSGVFAWYSWQRAEHPVSNWYALVLAADGVWAFAALMELLSPTDSIAIMWSWLVASATVFASVLWFQFVIEYTGDSQWIPDIVTWAVLAHAGVYTVVYAVNPGNLVAAERGVAQYGFLRLPYEVMGPIIFAEMAIIYTLLFAAFVFLGRFYIRTRNLYRKQAGVIFLITLLILVVNVAFIGGMTPIPLLDLTPVFFIVQAVAVGFALYKYDFLNVAPLAANTLLEEMSDLVFVVNADGRVVDWNTAADEYVGDTDQPMLSDVAIPDLGDAIDRENAVAETEETEVTTTKQDGALPQPVTYDVRTTPITDRFDIVRGTVVVLRDVTDRRARKRALENQNKRLEEFTGIVSHDLRNPLQVIDGKVELSRQSGDLSHLGDASRAVSRMERMLDDLLRLAREGQTIDETEPVAIDECCRAAWDTISNDSATLTLDTDRTVQADFSRLQQAFENLFRNSLEHAGSDVAITVGDFEDGIYIEDDGPGIPDAERDGIFDLGVTHSEDGTGVGLAIVKRVVEAHGWTVAVTDGENGGARFELKKLTTIPLQASAD